MIVRIYFFIFLLVTDVFSFGQTVSSVNTYNKVAKEFLDSNFQPSNTGFLLVDNIDSGIFIYLKNFLQSDTLSRRVSYDPGKTSLVEKIILDKTDRKIIDSFFSDYANFSWKGSDLVHYNMVSIDTINQLKKYGKQFFPLIQKKYHVLSINYVSKPIFLKENTVCIMYSVKSGDWFDGQSETLVVFKKIDAKWRIFIFNQLST